MTLHLCEHGEAGMAKKTDSAKNRHFWREMWKYFTEYSEVTGIQGIRYVTEKRSRVEKVFWIIVLLISLAGCIYMIFEILDKYNNRPVIVTFATHDTPIYEIPFPAVSICFESKFSRYKFDFSDLYHQVIDRGETATINETQLKTLQHLSILCDKAKDIGEVANNTVDEDFYVTVDEMTLYLSEDRDAGQEMARKMNSAKDKDFGHNVRKYFREFNESTGIHGLRYVTEKRSRVEKVFWTIILLLSLAGCIYMIYEILEKYNNSPVVVSFATRDTPIYQIPFPAVSICSESKYSGELFNYSDVYRKFDSEDTTVNDTQLRTFYHLSLLCDDDSSVEERANATVGEDFYATIDQMRPDPILPYCVLDDNLIPCEHIFTPTILDQGVCYSFNIFGRHEVFREDVQHYGNFYQVRNNSREYYDPETGYKDTAGIRAYPRRAFTSGADHALILFFRYDVKDVDVQCNSFFQGFRVLVHNPWDVPRLSKHYFRIPHRKVVVAAIEPELVETSDTVRKFSPEKRQCYMRDERPLKYFQDYSQPNCLLECTTNHTLSQCGCVQFYMPRHNDTPICGSGSDTCIENAEKDLKVKELESKIKGDDFCDCKPSCTNLKFNVETSHSDFYFKEYFETHSKDEEYDANTHWAVLQLYFKDEQFMTKERNELYGISDLISQLGGLLGLFTGFSLVTAVEIIYFCSMRIYYNERLYGLWSGPPS